MADGSWDETRTLLRPRKRNIGSIYSGAARMKNIYIAHNFSAALWVRFNVVPKLTMAGWSVCSTWHNMDPSSPELVDKEGAIQCINDLQKANVLILFAEQFSDTPGRGKYVEMGYAIATGKLVAVIVERSDDMNCVFFHHPNVMVFATVEDVLQAIGRP